MSRRRAGRRFASLLVVAVAAFATTATAAFANGKVEIVTQGAFPTEGVPKNTHYFHKIQEAVDATTSNDWVLVEPGDLRRRSQGRKAPPQDLDSRDGSQRGHS